VARPLVTLHFAQSLDGRIGFGPGSERALLSSEEGVVSAHRARREHDAVLVGIETVLHDDPRLTVRCAERQKLETAGAEVWLTAADGNGRVALPEALEALAARGVRRLLVEGGAKVLTSFLQAGFAQRAEIEIAPLWLGAPATPGVSELGIFQLSQALRLERMEVTRLGENVLVRGDIVYPRRSP
jgi:riboflavin biosynthesis pyrimidine reductase